MASARKLPSGAYRVLVYSHTDKVDGKPVRRYQSFTASTAAEAEFQASAFKRARDGANASKKGSTLWSEAVERYISSRSNLLSPSTIRGYRIMERNAYPLFRGLTLDQILRQGIVQQQINANAAGYSTKSLKNQIGLISGVLADSGFAPPKVQLPPSVEHPIPVPTRAEAERIVALLREEPDIECQALLALTSSLRQSEIAALTAADIDGAAVHVHSARVPDEYNRLVLKTVTKTSASTRTVLVPEYLAHKLAERCKDCPEGFLFGMSPGQLLKRFKRLLTRAGMPPYTIHSLRHCFAALMHAQGVPDKYVEEMGGWSSGHVLRKVYQYTFSEDAAAAKRAANTYFDALSGTMQHEMQHETKK